MQKPFDNAERRRYYGLRIGDIVSPKGINGKPHTEDCEVIDYGFMDNNKVMLKSKDGKEFPWVAEWCKIVTKVEDIPPVKIIRQKPRKWTNSDSWDEIMTRLDELENIELPYKSLRRPQPKDYQFDEENIKFSYDISNYYPAVTLWIGWKGFSYQISVVISEVDKNFEGKREHRQVFKTKKEAMVYCLNRWEIYVERKQYVKDYQSILKKTNLTV